MLSDTEVSWTFTLIQCSVSVIAFIYCLYRFPIKQLKKPWPSWNTIQKAQVTACISLTLMQSVLLIEIILHLIYIAICALECPQHLNFRLYSRIMNNFLQFGAIPMFAISGISLLVYALNKQDSFYIQQSHQHARMKLVLLVIGSSSGSLMVLCVWLSQFQALVEISHVTTIIFIILFCIILIGFVGSSELLLAYTVLRQVETVQSPISSEKTRLKRLLKQYFTMHTTGSMWEQIKLFIHIVCLIMIALAALSLYIWSDVIQSGRYIHYCAGISLCLVSFLINQVFVLISHLHQTLMAIQQAAHVTTSQQLYSSVTPSELILYSRLHDMKSQANEIKSMGPLKSSTFCRSGVVV